MTLELIAFLDVGANIGQTGNELRDLGYTGRIVSFEPQRKAYSKLYEVATLDPKWDAFNYGLGNRNAMNRLNISGLDASSSFLQFTENAIANLPDLVYVDSEMVETKRLDSVYTEICGKSKCVFLKIDTQGYESQVLEGCGETIANIVGLQLELSIVPQYAGEFLAEDMIKLIRGFGFTPYWFLPGHRNRYTSQLYQMDVIAFKT